MDIHMLANKYQTWVRWTHTDTFLEHILGVDAGETGDWTVNAYHYDALKSDVEHTGGVGGGVIIIRHPV